MTKLRLGSIEDGKTIRLTLDLPTPVDRNLTAYAEAVAQQTGQPAPAKARLAIEMLTRFMATDRGFARLRKATRRPEKPT